jgi:hypothetical protein
MVLQIKLDANGRPSKYKARLVAHGFKQQYRHDFSIAYAPLISLTRVLLVLSEAAIHNFKVDQMDVIGAFLEAKIEEELFMTLPAGITYQDGQLTIGLSEAKKEKVVIGVKKS